MAVSLKALKGAEKVSTVHFQGEQFDIGYLPGEFTGDLLDSVTQVDESKPTAALDAMAALILPVVKWWDVEDEQGQRLPVDLPNLKAMPLGVLKAIMDALKGDQQPGEAPAPSDAG